MYESVPDFYVLGVLWTVLEHVNRKIGVTSFAKGDESLGKFIGLQEAVLH